VLDEYFSHKFLHSLPNRYKTIATLLVRSDLQNVSLTSIVG
jgi:hypothetical protein